MMTPAGWSHGEIAFEIGRLLGNFVADHNLGRVFAAETGFRLSQNPDTVRAPDVAFVTTDRLPSEHAPGFFPGSPDLAVEVLSPTDTMSEVQAKVQDWLDAGTKQVWVADPDKRTVVIYRPQRVMEVFTSGDELRVDDLLPGFTLQVADVFK